VLVLNMRCSRQQQYFVFSTLPVGPVDSYQVDPMMMIS